MMAIFVWTIQDAVGLVGLGVMVVLFLVYCAYLYIGYLVERFHCWRQVRRWERVARKLDRQKQLDQDFKLKIGKVLDFQEACPHDHLDAAGRCDRCKKDCKRGTG